MPEAFDGWDYLSETLGRFQLMLRAHCRRRLEAMAGVTTLPGLGVSAGEVEALLAGPLHPAPERSRLMAAAMEEDSELLLEAWRAGGELLDGMSRLAREADIDLPLDHVVKALRLDAFEQALLVMCLAVELTPEIGRLYAFLQGDLSLNWPTGRLALAWLAPDWTDQEGARAALEPNGTLFAARILHRPNVRPRLDQPLYLDEQIAAYLLGSSGLDPALGDFCHLEWPVEGQTIGEAEPLARFLSKPSLVTRFCYLHGPYGSGRLEAARAISGRLGLNILVVDSAPLARNLERFQAHLGRIWREARLHHAALYFQNADSILEASGEGSPALERLMAAADRSGELVFLSGEKPWQPGASLNKYQVISWPFATPEEPARLSYWRRAIGERKIHPAVDLADIAGRFRFTPGQISDVWRTALQQARLREPDSPLVTNADIYYSAHHHATHRLGQMAEVIQLSHSWDDIVLPDMAMNQLQEISSRARHAHQVYREWGFGLKISTSRGLVAMFTGPSGTGKTMAAGIIARDLGLEMYRIDLSSVVSKYVGETEKNLSRIFDEAWRSNAVVFFDEADALFGKRSEVRDSHDRYANIEVDYLLQRLDSFEGIAILASNLSQNIDEAFQRRIQFAVNFPFPEEESRYRIWRQIWPAEAPLGEDIAFGFLASGFKLNGGEIRNVALQSAFLAASNGEQIGMQHILEGIVREMRKGGRLVQPEDFGPFAEQLKLE